MTFNVANGLARPPELVALLRRSGADVIGLQELATGQADEIRDSLLDLYPHQRLHPIGIPGKGLLSRYPIGAMELLHFYQGRPDMSALLDVDGMPMRIVIAHPPPPKLQRSGLGPSPATRRQIIGLLQVVHEGGPCVLMGDFNLPPAHPVYRLIAGSGLTDSYRAAGKGPGLTLPMRISRWAYQGHWLGDVRIKPFMRVDYVWFTRHFVTREAWVGGHAGPDHLPVFARAEMVEPEGIAVTKIERAPGRHPTSPKPLFAAKRPK